MPLYATEYRGHIMGREQAYYTGFPDFWWWRVQWLRTYVRHRFRIFMWTVLLRAPTAASWSSVEFGGVRRRTLEKLFTTVTTASPSSSFRHFVVLIKMREIHRQLRLLRPPPSLGTGMTPSLTVLLICDNGNVLQIQIIWHWTTSNARWGGYLCRWSLITD